MRRIYALAVLLLVVTVGNLACSKSNSAASLSQEEKYKLYYAATLTGEQSLKKDVIKRLGVGSGESPIPDHDFFTAFIDWDKTDAAMKFKDEINSPEKARDYVNKHLPN